MSKKKEHGDRNRSLSDKLLQEKVYYDWTITTAFYSVIHFVEDVLLPVTIEGQYCKCIADVRKVYKMNGRHEARSYLVTEVLGPGIGVKYNWLDDKSRYARYQTFKLQPADALKAQEFLNFIHKQCYPDKTVNEKK